MKLLNISRVKVGELSFPVKITNRAMIEYEHISGGTIAELDSTEKIIKFFYCTAKAGAKSINEEFNYDYEQFLDAIDEYYTETVTNFSKIIFQSGGDEKKQIEVKKLK